jgi:hypothetical protein
MKTQSRHPHYLPMVQGRLALEILAGVPSLGWFAWHGELPTMGSPAGEGTVVGSKPGRVLVKFSR